MRKQPKTLSKAAEGLSSEQILYALQKALRQSLGAETRNLLLKTLKLVYKLDEKEIPSNLERFDQLLGKILGPNKTPIVRKHIIEELKKAHHHQATNATT